MSAKAKIVRGLIGVLLTVAAFPVAATPSTGYYIYDESGHVIAEYDATGKVIQDHIWLGGQPLAVVQGGSLDQVTTDQLGTPQMITDSNRNVVWSWSGDPFGNGQATGSLTYNLRMPGQYYDAETGKNYNYFRDYDPATGRYIESDPIGLAAGVNTYSYVLNNPLMYTDPFGLCGGTGSPGDGGGGNNDGGDGNIGSGSGGSPPPQQPSNCINDYLNNAYGNITPDKTLASDFVNNNTFTGPNGPSNLFGFVTGNLSEVATEAGAEKLIKSSGGELPESLSLAGAVFTASKAFVELMHGITATRMYNEAQLSCEGKSVY